MARKIYYKIIDDGRNAIADGEWEEIARLQHWYNSEFIWTAGRLSLKMYAVFPDTERRSEEAGELRRMIRRRREELERAGCSENEAIRTLIAEGLIIAHKGGYFDDCLASGFTRVAGNEFNAYLVCDFLLKVSRLSPRIAVNVYDEGEFIKSHEAAFDGGNVAVGVRDEARLWYYEGLVKNRHLFAVVDAGKYDAYPRFESTISDFNERPLDEKMSILHDWNWLGFENNFDINGDDIQGFDLNRKVGSFRLTRRPA